MAEVIASEAKLRISLDTKQAADDLKKMDGGADPGAAGPGAGGPGTGKGGPPAPDEGEPDRPADPDSPSSRGRTGRSADRPYVGGSGPGSMSGRELYNRAQAAYGVVASGRLYDTALQSARSLPYGIGTIVQGAELNRKFGAYGQGAAEAIAKNMMDVIPDEVMRPEVREFAGQLLVKQLVGASKETQDAMNTAKHWSNAVGTSISAVQALAWGKAVKDEKLGLDDVADLADFGARVAQSDVMFQEIDTRKRINFQSKMSAALVNGLFDAVKGNAGR